MSGLQHVYCRFCEQTFLTAPGSEECDLCRESGGLISPEVAAKEQEQKDIQRAAAVKGAAKGPSTRQIICGLCAVVLLSSALTHVRRAPRDTLAWAIELAFIGVPLLGIVVTLLWPAKKKKGGLPPSDGDKPPSSPEQS